MDFPATDLTDKHEILQAHRRHRRLIRLHGRRQVHISYLAAFYICRKWHDRRHRDAIFDQQMERFHGPEWSVPFESPTVEASHYPQAVALTRLLASPYWRTLALRENLGSAHGGLRRDSRPPDVLSTGSALRRFVSEVQRTVASDYGWDPYPHWRAYDPLVEWIRLEIYRSEKPILRERYHADAYSDQID